jgi:predicted PurR-regulated permease PerM
MKDIVRSAWMRLLLLVAGLLLFVWLLLAVRQVLTPFAVAFALAYFLNPLANALERILQRGIERSRLLRGWLHPRSAAVGIIAGLVLVVVVVLILFVVPTVMQQLVDTAKKLPDWARTIRAKVEPAIQRLNLRYPEQAEQVRVRLTEFVQTHLPQILSPITHALQAAFSSVLSLVLSILNLVVIPVFAFYLLHDMNQIRDGARELVPERHRAYVYSRARQVDSLLSAFARGQIAVCLILGTFYAIALSFCNVPMGFLVGYVVAFFNLIPFMSTVLGLPLTLLLKFVEDQSLSGLLAVTAVFAVGQFVEGNFITPRIVGTKLGLHAVVMMLAVLVGGTLFGFVGMLIAVPVTAALSVFWADLRELYMQSEFYRAETTEPPQAPPPPPPVTPAPPV